MDVKPFRIERYYDRYEFTTRYMLSSSDCESRTIEDLLALEPEAHARLLATWCGYTESPGAPELREAIAALYERVEPDDVIVHADERKVHQVLSNLLSNALKFTPSAGHVDVVARMADDRLEVSVSDTGPGIALEEQELIFEEFGQAKNGSGATHEGTGLGLPLARKLVELHGGRLWVESAVGEGSTFRFVLPARS